MKKVLLITLSIFALFTASSCSDETSEPLFRPYGTITFTVDGAEKTYNHVLVTELVQSNGDKFLKVVGSQNGNPSEAISFRLEKYTTGPNLITRWEYVDDHNFSKRWHINGEEYNIQSNMLLNTDNRLKGTFSGRLYNVYSNRHITVEEGEFSYNFNLPEE